jgi:uncharacterized membrane protein
VRPWPRLRPTHQELLHYAWLGFCCLGVGVIAAILHSRRCLWFDELTTVMTSQRPFWEAIVQLEDYSAPIYQLLMRLAGHGFPPEWVVRAPAFLSAILGLITTWWLARTLFGDRVAAFSLLVVGFNPVFLWYAVEGRPYSLFLFLSVLSIATYYRSLRQPTRGWLLLYVLSSVALVYSHYYGVLVLLAEAVFLAAVAAFRREDYGVKKVFLAFMVAGVAVLPALWLASRYVFTGLAGLRSNVPKLGCKALLLASLGDSAFNSMTLGVLCFWAIGVALWVILRSTRNPSPSCEGEQGSGRDSTWAILLCLVWFACSYYLLVVVTVFVKPILSPRYVVPAMVPCAILLSAVVCRMPRSVSVLVLLLIAAAYYPSVKSTLREARTDYPDLTARLRQANSHRDRVYVTGCPDYRYYRSALEVGLRYYGYDEPNIAVLDLSWDETQGAYVVRQPTLLEKGKACFVVSHWPGYEQPVDVCLQRSSRSFAKHSYGDLTLFEVKE